MKNPVGEPKQKIRLGSQNPVGEPKNIWLGSQKIRLGSQKIRLGSHFSALAGWKIRLGSQKNLVGEPNLTLLTVQTVCRFFGIHRLLFHSKFKQELSESFTQAYSFFTFFMQNSKPKNQTDPQHCTLMRFGYFHSSLLLQMKFSYFCIDLNYLFLNLGQF